MYLYQDGTFSKTLENNKELKGVISRAFPGGGFDFCPLQIINEGWSHERASEEK